MKLIFRVKMLLKQHIAHPLKVRYAKRVFISKVMTVIKDHSLAMMLSTCKLSSFYVQNNPSKIKQLSTFCQFEILKIKAHLELYLIMFPSSPATFPSILNL